MGRSGGISGSSNSPNTLALGLATQTIDVYLASTHFTAAAGNFLAVLAYLPAGSISTLGLWLQTAGVTGTGVNAMGLYTSAGVKVDVTGDMTSALSGATGWATGALTGGSQGVAAGAYYVAVLTHFTSNPEIAGAAAVATIPIVNSRYPSVFLSAQATMPASFTPSAATRNSGAYYYTVS